MAADLEQNKQRLLRLCRENIRRDGLEPLLQWLEKSDFFSAPASSRFHGAYEGGLCEHCLDVYDYAHRIAAGCGLTLPEESLTIAALFHDLCKVHFYKTEMRNKKNEDGVWEKVPYYAVEERFAFGGHGAKSVFLVERFMRLEMEEAVAINCHMGFVDGPATVPSISSAYHKSNLAWVIHAADEAATFLLERE